MTAEQWIKFERASQEISARIEKNPQMLMQLQAVETHQLSWIMVHAALCLALNHPHFIEGRELIEEFTEALGKALVQWGIMTADELNILSKVEKEIARCSVA